MGWGYKGGWKASYHLSLHPSTANPTLFDSRSNWIRGFSSATPTMPTRAHKVNTDGLYEAIRNGNGVPFEFITGGVKYRAVLAAKADKYVENGHQ